jgi:hypothetical protein
MTTPAVLVLEDGRMFRGTGFGAAGGKGAPRRHGGETTTL